MKYDAHYKVSLTLLYSLYSLSLYFWILYLPNTYEMRIDSDIS